MHGWDPVLRAIVDEQREYLRSHPSVLGETSWDGADGQDPRGRRTNVAQPTYSGKARAGDDALLTAGLFSASCSSPGIALINGQAAEAVFTPEAPDNRYRIEGCGFGLEPGKAWIESESSASSPGGAGRVIGLQLDGSGGWSDTEIDAHFEAGLSGIADSTIRLVVQRADGTLLQVGGCHFVAARGEPTLIRTIPASWVNLDPTKSSLRPIRQLEFVSTPLAGDDVPANAVGTSALIVRSDPDEFVTGVDAYDFSWLAPGWVVESVQVQKYVVNCAGDVTRTSTADDWRTAFDAHGFRVWWSRNSCSSFIPPVFHFDMTSSEYGVKVWVVGPLGTEAMPNGLGSSRNH